MAKDATKVVVRLLPPEITEEELLSTVRESLQQHIMWKDFQAGKRYKGDAKPSRNARCYFQFGSLVRAEDFIKEYHGHQFVDGRGEPFRAVACYAPYQKVPRLKPQQDPRDGTIEDDNAYKEFVKTLSEPRGPYVAPVNPVIALKPTDPSDTPLINHLKTRSKERSRARFEKKDKKRWRDGMGGLDHIEEEPKRVKWRCAECGSSKHLEEDPDNRGTFYCTHCWESWETQKTPAPKVKKKKKKTEESEEWYAEETKGVSSRKYKKHAKDRDAANDVHSHYEWKTRSVHDAKTSRSSRTSNMVEEEDAEARGRRKKKKSKDDDYMDGDVDVTRSSVRQWRIKSGETPFDEASSADYEKDRHRAKTKYREREADDWWEDGKSQHRWERRSDRISSSYERYDKYDGSHGGTWKAKDTYSSTGTSEYDHTERDDRPRRARKDRRADDEECASHWVPKPRYK